MNAINLLYEVLIIINMKFELTNKLFNEQFLQVRNPIIRSIVNLLRIFNYD